MSLESKRVIEEVLEEYFKDTYQISANGELRFIFSDGVAEKFQSGRHQMATSQGVWYSRPDFYFGGELFICASAMEAVSFAALQSEKSSTLHQAVWLSAGLRCSLPVASHHIFGCRKVNLLFGRGLLDTLIAVKICLSLKSYQVNFWLDDELLHCRFRGKQHVFSVDGFSLSRFKQATGLRDYSRMRRPGGADSYLDKMLLGI